MMHKLLLAVAAALLFSATAFSQSLKVFRGQVAVSVPAVSAADMQYTDGGDTLRIMDLAFATAEIDSIVCSRAAGLSQCVEVAYEGELAKVTVAADAAKWLEIGASAADVSIVADPLLSTELTYVLSGSSEDGSFFMDGELKASFVLDGLTLTNKRGAAIDIACGKRISVELPEGTVTTLADGVGGSQKACFFVNGHPEFKGGGTLNLVGNTKHAFASDEYTQFKSSFGTLNVTYAVSDGLHIDQYFEQNGGTINISGTKGDCIDVSLTKDAEDEFNGQAFLTGGTLNLAVEADDVKGLKTETSATISGGTLYAVVSGDGSKGISTDTDLFVNNSSGSDPLIRMELTGGTYMPGDAELESKCRGIKVKGDFTFDGGSIEMTWDSSKNKGISVDGQYIYLNGSTNVNVN